MSSRNLITQRLSGQSARSIIEELTDTLPPAPQLKCSIQQDLPRDVQVSIKEEIVTLIGSDASTLHERADFLQRVYPELEFVVKK